MAGPGGSPARSRTFIVRILRQERNDWQGQLVDVGSGEIHAFASFLQFQRLLLSLGDETRDELASRAPSQGTRAEGLGRRR